MHLSRAIASTDLAGRPHRALEEGALHNDLPTDDAQLNNKSGRDLGLTFTLSLGLRWRRLSARRRARRVCGTSQVPTV